MQRLIRLWFRTEIILMLALLATLAAVATVRPAHAQAQEEVELLDRLQRLEALVRGLNGKVEELQFRNREMESKLQRFQSDAEFRFNSLEGGGKAAAPARAPAATPPTQPQRRSDAYDPAAEQGAAVAPAAPPGNLAAMSPGANASAPVRSAAAGSPVDLATMSQNAASGVEPAPRAAQNPPVAVVASLSPREEYDEAARLLKSNQLDAAEQAFRTFVQRNPKSGLIPDAYYNIGESLYQRRRFRDAAESFLKVTTDYSASTRAPASLLKLGQSLAGMGERESACAAYAELNRKYPNGPSGVLNAALSEQRRAKC